MHRSEEGCIVAGHLEGFPKGGFANINSEAAECTVEEHSGASVDPLVLHFPQAIGRIHGVAFVGAAIDRASSAVHGRVC